ncbi:hypothetical protein NKI98_21750 [Mesorhizobium sp. M0222]|uniref:hypothetical protein n=1 Tax=Mesorhizobium sp. M0222 TaxID=2956921 RepID=UPI00333AA460
MPDRIEILEANLRNIAIFHEEPGEQIIEEVKGHVRATAMPWTWRGHSHTRPPDEAFVVYIEEFDVPAKDTVPRVAPCPCCTPHHPKYKNKGKIAWFPNESVIRLIGPKCFASINAGGHEAAIIDLRKRQKRRSELATVALHGAKLEELVAAIDAAIPIADHLDAFMRDLAGAADQERLNFWRELREGTLTITERRRSLVRKADGRLSERDEEFRSTFASILGHSIFDRSQHGSAGKLRPLRSGLALLVNRVSEADQLGEADLEKVAEALPKARTSALDIFSGLSDRQRFLTSNAIEILAHWGQHPSSPLRFAISRKRSEVTLVGHKPHVIYIGLDATSPIPPIPEL